MKRKVFILFIAVLLVVALFPLEALAATKETVVSQSTMHCTKAISTFTSITREHPTYVMTIVHVTGTPSYRDVGGTYWFDASSSLASPMYPSTFAAHNTSDLGLVKTKQLTADTSVSISATKASGTYKVYVKWSGMKWNQKVVTTYSGGSTTEQNRTISYAPCKTSKVTGASARL